MLSNKLVSASVIALSLTAASSQAAEVSLNSYVSGLLSEAVATTQQEIQYSVKEAVLNVSHTFSLSEKEAVQSSVSIKEIAQTESRDELKDEQAES